MNRRLLRFLRRAGVPQSEIDDAASGGWLALLTIDRLLVPGPARFRRLDVAQESGVDADVSQRLWRALGFPDVGDDEQVFTEEAVFMLRELRRRMDSPFVAAPEQRRGEDLVQQVRAVSAGLSRVAEVLSDQIGEAVEAGADAGLSDEEIAVLLLDTLDWPSLARLNDYALRLQVRAAVWRKLGREDEASTSELAVGFLDLVGYTAMSQELDEDQLVTLVDRFEALAHDTVAQFGGRLVKTIGDEAMFVADSADVIAEIALRLTERTGRDDVLPDARAGIACGPVLSRDGDYYGPVVNLAHRLVEVARPATVIVSGAVRDALTGDDRFAFSRARVRRIRDIGRVETYALRGGPDRQATGEIPSIR